MNEDPDKLQRSLEQATAAEGASADGLDPETASLREAWLAFGQLLEAAQPPLDKFPLPVTGERQEGRAMRPDRLRRWLVPIAGLLAASLLVGIAITWMSRTTNPSENVRPAPEQTASTNRPVTAPAYEQPQPTTTAKGPQWDDSFDEQLAQLGQQMAYAREGQSCQSDDIALVQYRMEQFRQEIQADSF
jgi:hypothetical protein